MKDAKAAVSLTTSPSSILLKEPEVAALLRRSLPTIRRWRRDNAGPPYIRLGRAILYESARLEEFIVAHRVEIDEVSR